MARARAIDPGMVWTITDADLGELGRSEPAAPSDRITRLRQTISAEIGAGKFQIPPLPRTAIELHKLTSQPEPDLKEVIDLIYRDQTLAARVIALASSAAHGAARQISDLRVAVTRVGANGVRDIAFTLALGKVFRCRALDVAMHDEARRAYVLGCATMFVARCLRLEMMYGFLCGLLADVGRPALLATLARLGEDDPKWLEPSVLSSALEQLHADVGALVVTTWELPDILRACARYHHDPAKAGAALPIVLAVAAADAALGIEADDANQLAEALASQPVVFQAGLQAEHLPKLARVIEQARAES